MASLKNGIHGIHGIHAILPLGIEGVVLFSRQYPTAKLQATNIVHFLVFFVNLGEQSPTLS